MNCVFGCLNNVVEAGRQEDADEFTVALLDKLNETSHRRNGTWETAYANKNTQSEVQKAAACVDSMRQSAFDRCFKFALQNRVWNRCNCTSIKWDQCEMLNIEVRKETKKKTTKTLKNLLDAFFKVESFTEDNTWKCPKECSSGRTKRDLKLWNTPPVLIINLKRYAYDNHGGRRRVSDRVTAPLCLDVSPYMAPYALQGALDEAKQGYRLRAFVVHKGSSAKRGHYISYVRNHANAWHQCDDSRITITEIDGTNGIREEVQGAYILFYDRS